MIELQFELRVGLSYLVNTIWYKIISEIRSILVLDSNQMTDGARLPLVLE